MSLKHHSVVARTATSPSQLAHELNNLLDGALRSVGLTRRQIDALPIDAPDKAKFEKQLGTAVQSMRQMVEVVERYANQPPGQTPSLHDLVQNSGTLLDVLTHAVNVYGPKIEQQGVALVTRLDPDIGLLPAGPAYTVLANAINNAVQAVEPDRLPADTLHRITLRLVHDPADATRVLIEVTDTGAGLDPRLIDHDGGFRFGVTTRPQGHGVGLGVCQQIAQTWAAPLR